VSAPPRTLFCPRCEQDVALQAGRRIRYTAHVRPNGEPCPLSRCTESGVADTLVLEAAIVVAEVRKVYASIRARKPQPLNAKPLPSPLETLERLDHAVEVRDRFYASLRALRFGP
jgi:hypothetical protein